MNYSCVECSKLATCKILPEEIANQITDCDIFSPAPWSAVSARNEYIRLTRATKLKELKGKITMPPKAPIVSAIVSFVENRDRTGLEKFLETEEPQLSYLMLACGTITGDPQEVAKKVRSSSDRRQALIDIILNAIPSAAEAAVADEAARIEEAKAAEKIDQMKAEEAEVATAAPKRRRGRRKKAEIEAEKAAQAAAQEAEAATASEPVSAPASAPAAIDLSPIMAAVEAMNTGLAKEIEKQGKSRNDAMEQIHQLYVKLSEQLDAVQAQQNEMAENFQAIKDTFGF